MALLSTTIRLCSSRIARKTRALSHVFVPDHYQRFSFFSTGSSNADDSTVPGSNSNKPLDMAFGPVNAFQMNQYVIACTKTGDAALIDCGASTQKELDAFLNWIQTKDYNLTAVWQTHAHLDHIAGLGLLHQKYPGLPIYVHERERDIYNHFETTKTNYGFPVEGDGGLPNDDKLTFWNDQQTSISLGELTMDIIQTPGHSPGHIGFYEPLSKSFFGGDFIMQGSVGRTDFPTSSPDDMNKSLKQFVKTMGDETVIYPGHGSPTLLQQEKQSNPFLQDFLQ